jgi:hypothetical protein
MVAKNKRSGLFRDNINDEDKESFILTLWKSNLESISEGIIYHKEHTLEFETISQHPFQGMLKMLGSKNTLAYL